GGLPGPLGQALQGRLGFLRQRRLGCSFCQPVEDLQRLGLPGKPRHFYRAGNPVKLSNFFAKRIAGQADPGGGKLRRSREESVRTAASIIAVWLPFCKSAAPVNRSARPGPSMARNSPSNRANSLVC